MPSANVFSFGPTPCSPGFDGWMGIARRDITPPVGIHARNWGAAVHDVATHVHRPLTATVTCLREEPQAPPAFVVSLDLGWWKDRGDEFLLRKAVADTAAVEPDRVFLNLSHTHSGPSLHEGDRDRPGGHLIEAYRGVVCAQLADATRAAMESVVPVRGEFGYSYSTVPVDRDLVDPANPTRCIVGWNPASDFPPARVTVGRFCQLDGSPIAAWVHVPCHPTTLGPGNRALSPDFAGALRETVEGALGVPCQFLQGASGNLAPKEQYTDDPDVCDRHGRSLGFSALAAWHALSSPGKELRYAGTMESGAPLALWHPVARPNSSGIDCRSHAVLLAVKDAIEAVPGLQQGAAHEERRRRVEQLRRLVGDERPFPMRLAVWRIGSLHLLGVPGEAYSDLSDEWANLWPEGLSLVCNCTNGWFGYLPPRRAYAVEDIYPVLQSPFDAGCHEAVVDALGRLVESVGKNTT